ncbi:putative transcription factor bHLH family [Helianthus annuus]|nr:putative transcription factor bHLH family [Helianthus annuus]
MDNRGFMSRDDMCKPYNRSFQTPTSFEDQTETKLPGYDHKASSINTACQTSKTIVTSLSSSNTFTIPFDDSVGLQVSGTGKVQTVTRALVQVQDHVLAERNRREKLNRHLISLSALLPNLKKKDKVSVLEDAANYIKELQDRVKQLEGLSGIEKNGDKECIVALKRSRIRGDNDMGSSPKNETNTADVTCKASTEIEVRISIRKQCASNTSVSEKLFFASESAKQDAETWAIHN